MQLHDTAVMVVTIISNITNIQYSNSNRKRETDQLLLKKTHYFRQRNGNENYTHREIVESGCLTLSIIHVGLDWSPPLENNCHVSEPNTHMNCILKIHGVSGGFVSR